MLKFLKVESLKVSILIENIYFRIPQEKWHIYPAWLFLYIQDIIVPVISLSAITTKILMKREMKRYLFGNNIHPVSVDLIQLSALNLMEIPLGGTNTVDS